MPLDDTPSERQRQAHTAALFIESPRVAVVYSLYAGCFSDDHDCGALAVDRFDPSLGDDLARPGLLAQNCSKNGVERAAKPDRIARHCRPLRPPSGLEANVSVPCFLHKAGHLSDKRERVYRPLPKLKDPGVKLGHLAQFADNRHQSSARFLGFFDHLALPLAQGLIGIPLQHAQVSADDAGWGAKFVNREGEELRITLVQGLHVWVTFIARRSIKRVGQSASTDELARRRRCEVRVPHVVGLD